MIFRRNPVPEHLYDRLELPGGPMIRIWGDAEPSFFEHWLKTPDEDIRRTFPEVCFKPHHYLAISGGGANGAFGAGFLRGWTEAGTRPQFAVVTGISTGALAAPFAFLGPDFDDRLEHIYTAYSTKDLVRKHVSVAALASGGMLNTRGLKRAIDQHITQDIVDRIAVEYRKGRNLWIGTTNLDTLRPVIWGLGPIASGGGDEALPLIRNILHASAAIPIAFPPVKFQFNCEGRTYDELHGDGGASAQIFLFPIGMDWTRVMRKLAVQGKPNFYLIRNAKFEPSWAPVKPRLFPVALRTMSSLIRTQGIGDSFRLYLTAQKYDCNFHIAYIPEGFREIPIERFDPAYMRKLFEKGREMARSGGGWNTIPPGF